MSRHRLHVAAIALALPFLLATAWQGEPAMPQTTKLAEPTPVLLYDTLVDPSVLVEARGTGALPLLLIYQYCSPDSKSTGNIDVGAVLMCIDRLTQGDPPAWGMLDFEYRFTDRMQAGVGGAGAIHARDEMIRLIRAVRAAFPKTRWTFYGVPFLPYWLDHRSWLDATDDRKRTEMMQCAEMYGPIVAECDWVSPSIYPVYDPSMFDAPQRAGVRRAGIAWRSAQIGFARLLARGKPVIPTISPVWQPGGLAPSGRVVPPDQFVDDQVRPALAAGASGVAIWTSYDRLIAAACEERPESPSVEFPRANLASSLLGGAVPEDWKAPGLAQRMRECAAQVVLRSLRDVRRPDDAGAPPSSSGPS
ncbi:MAG: hypothetical protein FJ292_00450 [Planctomycetes bacterium]|nr:hypothetical protein [Planctomycetota bacterium]